MRPILFSTLAHSSSGAAMLTAELLGDRYMQRRARPDVKTLQANDHEN